MTKSTRLVKIIGFALLAVAWLPLSFSARPQAYGFPPTGQIRERIPNEAAFAVLFPIQSVQLHQFRLSGAQSWFSKSFGPDSVKLGCSCSWVDLNGPETWLRASAPGELLKAWQFTLRMALHPRAPCWV